MTNRVEESVLRIQTCVTGCTLLLEPAAHHAVAAVDAGLNVEQLNGSNTGMHSFL